MNDMGDLTQRSLEIFENYKDDFKRCEITLPSFRIDDKDL